MGIPAPWGTVTAGTGCAARLGVSRTPVECLQLPEIRPSGQLKFPFAWLSVGDTRAVCLRWLSQPIGSSDWQLYTSLKKKRKCIINKCCLQGCLSEREDC